MADDGMPPGERSATPAAGPTLGDSESIVFKNPDAPAAPAAPEALPAADDGAGVDIDAFERPPQFDVHYTCLRCGTDVSNAELDRLPEIKCICGYKVFIKVRPPIVKTVNAV